jgi:CHAD domain-containing protein
MAIEPERIQKSLAKLHKFAKKAPRRPSPKKIHSIRTNARKLETMLEAMQLDSKKNEKRLIKGLSRIRRLAGKVRDMDVLTGHLAGMHADGEDDCLLQLIEHLGSGRDKQARKLHRATTDQRTELKKRLRTASAHVEKALTKPSRAPEVAAHASANALQLSAELDEPRRLTRANLHPYRLKVKELRNVLQLGEQSDNMKFVDDLGKVKDAIGEWHDWEELVAIATEVLDHGPGCGLLRQLKQRSQAKYELGLQAAENLRKSYLQKSIRRKRRIRGREPEGKLAPPALLAASAISGDGRKRAA